MRLYRGRDDIEIVAPRNGEFVMLRIARPHIAPVEFHAKDPPMMRKIEPDQSADFGSVPTYIEVIATFFYFAGIFGFIFTRIPDARIEDSIIPCAKSPDVEPGPFATGRRL